MYVINYGYRNQRLQIYSDSMHSICLTNVELYDIKNYILISNVNEWRIKSKINDILFPYVPLLRALGISGSTFNLCKLVDSACDENGIVRIHWFSDRMSSKFWYSRDRAHRISGRTRAGNDNERKAI